MSPRGAYRESAAALGATMIDPTAGRRGYASPDQARFLENFGLTRRSWLLLATGVALAVGGIALLVWLP